jgi:hypoxanthine phosphoribosyltransferase
MWSTVLVTTVQGGSSVSDERERLSWSEFGTASVAMAQAVVDSGYRPDMILAIARGGLLVAGALGYALGVKNLYTMNVEYYTGVDQRHEVPMILPPTPELVDVEAARVLIADDVADTGHTLALVKQFCTGKVAEVRCVVLYEKPRSVVQCEFVWKKTDLWIEFPWSDRPPLLGGVADA